jgi:hypothetical protein
MSILAFALIVLAVVPAAFGQQSGGVQKEVVQSIHKHQPDFVIEYRVKDPACPGRTPYCKDMANCAEACFHFLKCGAKNLDRDGDLIPCENVCKRPCSQ